MSGSLHRDHSQIKIGNKEKHVGAELCQAQRCLVGYEIRLEQNYFQQNEFYRNEHCQNALSQLDFHQNDFRQ